MSREKNPNRYILLAINHLSLPDRPTFTYYCEIVDCRGNVVISTLTSKYITERRK
jgi:hypothetical protein